jgi:PAS domain S-box-containing protein
MTQKKTDEQIDSQQNLENFYNISVDLFCIAGIDGYFKELNPQWEKSTGYTLDELKSRPYMAFVYPEDLQSTGNNNSKANEGNRTDNFRNRYVCKDGSIIWLEWSSVTNNETGLIYAVARNVTTDVEKEKIIQKFITRASEAEKIAHLGYWELDLVSNEVIWSDEYFRICGHEPKSFIPTIEISEKSIHPDDYEYAIATFKKALQGEHYEIEERIIQPSGKVKNVLSKGHLIYNDDNTPIKFIGTFQDITQQKEVEATLHSYVSKLEESNQNLDDFAHIASNDLREPLRGIKTLIEFFLEDYKNGLTKEGIDMLEQAVSRTNIIDNRLRALLKYSKINRTELTMEQVNIGTIAQNAVHQLGPLVKDISISIQENMPEIAGDELLIIEILENLISNGIKYNDKENKSIDIGYLDESPLIYFVRDNGIGIKEDQMKAIFDIFNRLPGSKDFSDGSGVGLTIIKKMVEHHSGSIWVDSVLNKGSTFYFTISPKVSTK